MLVPVNQLRTPTLESGILAWKEIISVQITAIQDQHKLDTDPALDSGILTWEKIISVQISDIQDQYELDADPAPAVISNDSNLSSTSSFRFRINCSKQEFELSSVTF